MMRKTKLPEFLKPYFWDVDFETLELDKAPTFILKRIIDKGDTTALRWAQKRFSSNDIKKLVTKTRDISRKSANFWTLVLGLKSKEVPCLQKPYSRIPFGLSS